MHQLYFSCTNYIFQAPVMFFMHQLYFSCTSYIFHASDIFFMHQLYFSSTSYIFQAPVIFFMQQLYFSQVLQNSKLCGLLANPLSWGAPGKPRLSPGAPRGCWWFAFGALPLPVGVATVLWVLLNVNIVATDSCPNNCLGPHATLTP